MPDVEKADPNLLTSRLDTESIIAGPDNTQASQLSERPCSTKLLAHCKPLKHEQQKISKPVVFANSGANFFKT